MQTICRLLGYSPQAYHKQQKHKLHPTVNEEVMLQQIDAIRKQQPRCGGRKLFIMLQSFFHQYNINIGKDRFFDFLKRYKLLVGKTKRCAY